MRYIYLTLSFFLSIASSSFCQSNIDSILVELNSATSETARYKILDPLTTEMVRENHPNQVKYLDTLINIALKRKEYDVAAQKSRFVIYQLNRELKYKESFKLIDSLLKFKAQFKSPKSEGHLLLKKGGVHFSLTEFKRAIENYQNSIPLFYKSGDSIYVADAEYFSGQAYYLNGNFSMAIQSFDKAKNLYNKLGDLEYSNLVALESINLLNSNGLKKVGQERFKELLEISKTSENNCLTAIVYLNILSVELNTPESSSISYDDVQKSIDKCDNPYQNLRHEFYLKIQQVKDAIKKNTKAEAFQYFEELLVIEKRLKDPYELSYSIKAKVAYYRYAGHLNQALTALNEYFEITKNYPINNLRVNAEKVASELYSEIGNVNKANIHLTKYVKFKDSLYTAQAANSYTYYQTKFETSEKEKEIIRQEASIKQLENEKEIEQSRNNVVLLVLLSVLIIISGVAYYFLERSNRRRRYLAKQLDKSKIELKEFTRQLIIRGNEKDKLKNEFEHLKRLYGEEEELKELQILADSKILTNNDWDNFKEKFKVVYPNFFINLKKKGFKFTNAEERLIALEKLELKTNEIANMLAISPDSVLTGRYRLRKKLKASKEIGIIDYLES